MKSQLESVWRQTGNKPKELEDLIELPESFYEVYGFFLDLNSSRQNGMNGYLPISYSEILAYFELMQIQPEEWEIKTIKAFDRVFLEHAAKEQDKNAKKPKSK